MNRTELDAFLASAQAAGVIDGDAVARLARHADQGEGHAEEERFRLLSGFGDIFTALACLLLGVGIFLVLPTGPAGVVAAIAAWLLAEIFTRRRRQALPSIVLLAGFVGSVFAAGFGLIRASASYQDSIIRVRETVPGCKPPPELNVDAARFCSFESVTEPWMGAAVAVAAALAAVSAFFHWQRFRVPITVAAGAGALVGVSLGLADAVGVPEWASLLLMLGCGLAAFVAAMAFDMQDRLRVTRAADVSFWLHLLAGPLIVHSIVALTGLTDPDAPAFAAPATLGLFLLFLLVALAIDRRALLVSSLVYVIVALSKLLGPSSRASLGQPELQLGGVVVALALLLLLLSGAWGWLRARLVPRLPATLGARLPPAVSA